MFDASLLGRNLAKGYIALSLLVATPVGFALEPHGGSAGDLFEFNGSVYFVPAYIERGQAHFNLSKVQQVTANPTDYFKDMTFAPVDEQTLALGLDDALRLAARRGYPKASANQKLIFG